MNKEENIKEDNYRSFFNLSSDFLFVLDRQGRIIEANQAVYERLDYRKEELEGQSVLKLHPEERRAEAKETVDRMLRDETDICLIPVINKHKVQIPVETRIIKGFWNGEEVLYGICKDMSKLRLSEEKFSKAFYLNPMLCSISDMSTGKLIEVNDAFINTLGFTKGESIGRSIKELGILSDEQFDKISCKVESEGNIRNYETTIRAKEGILRHVLLSSENIYIQDKQYRYTIAHDITERKKAEEIARDIIEKNPMSIQIVDREGYTESVNKAHTNLFGAIPPDDFSLFTDPQLKEQGLDEIVKRIKKGEVVYFPDTYYNTHKLNSDYPDKKLWISAVIFPLKDVNGEHERYVIMHENISDRKHAEESLKESEERYRILIEKMGEGIGVMDTDENFVLTNPAAEKIFGVGSGKLDGRNLSEFIDEESYKRVRKETKKRSGGGSSVYELEIILKDSSKRHILVTATPRFHNNKFSGTFGIFRDITERKKSEEMIRQKNEQLEQINAEKDKFFSIIAHDLRSPLSGFLRLTERMVKKLDSMPLVQIQQMVDLMNESASNLYNLLENLLEWSNIRRGSTIFNQERLILNLKVNEAVCLMNESIKTKEIELIIDINEDTEIYADRKMTESILRNLISNAIKFTGEKGQIKITSNKIKGKLVEICVEDNGIGMNNSLRENLFKLDSNVTRPGTDGEASTGLGLLLCKEFVEKHKGIIRAESEIGKGSRFIFTLPGC